VTTRPRVVVWDIGNVLVRWDPRRLYRTLLPDDASVERFLSEICTDAWNARQDAGRPLAAGTAELVAAHPEEAALIRAYYGRWEEMLDGVIEGSVVLVDELSAAGVPQYALSNWSAETFDRVADRFSFLDRFEAIVISGREGVAKPDPEIFSVLLDRYGLRAPSCLFVDDVEGHLRTAGALGFATERFVSPEGVRRRLVAERFLPG
jgi:2-haloacid dehalogenase